MGYMKRFKCPHCLKTEFVIRKTKRGKSIRYFCKKCLKYFSISTVWIDKKSILNDHLDGLSFRKLAVKHKISKSLAWEICNSELKSLPNNNQFTHKYCDRFSKIFLFDGKYFNIASEKYDWVLLWGIDYFRHDIPVFTIAPNENYQSWSKCFSYFRILNCQPELIVCDDNVNLKMAARNRFLGCKIQTCYNHFKENIRRNLHIRSETGKQYKDFMRRIESVLSSSQKLADHTLNDWMFCLFRDYKHDPVCLSILTNIEKYKKELLAYRGVKHAPVTTNLIEGMNSHIEARLQALRSFQTIEYARLWFNGYILKRRFSKFTDCQGKFRFLTGKSGLMMTQKQGVVLPTYF